MTARPFPMSASAIDPARIDAALALVQSDPAQAYGTLRRLSRDSLLDPAAGTALARAYADPDSSADAPPLRRAWALLLGAGHPLPDRKADATIADARAARDLFAAGGIGPAAAWALEVAGFALAKRRGEGDLAAAGQALAEALALREADAENDDELARFDLSEGLVYLGWLKAGADAEAALAHFDRGIALAGTNPEGFWPRWSLVRHLEGRGRLLVNRDLPGDWARAEADYRRALTLRDGLLADLPDAPVLARERFTLLTHLAGLLGRGSGERRPEALALYEQALADARGRVAQAPDGSEGLRDLALSLAAHADLLVATGSDEDLERAARQYAEALVIREGLLAAHPEATETRRDLRLLFRKLAELAERRGDPAALDWWRRALDTALAMRRDGTLAADEGWVVGLLRRRYLRAWLLAGWRRLRGRGRGRAVGL